MDSFRLLIELKKQERDLAQKIKVVQRFAIDDAIAFGKVGKLTIIEGATVTLKLVTVKPKPPAEVQITIECLEFEREKLKTANRDRIAALEAELKSLTTNSEIEEMELEIETAMSAIGGEKIGQISITLPK